MAEVLFYHLTESTLEDALPGLLERSLGRGWRVVVQTGTEERRDALDAHLWTFRDDLFLAHGTDRDQHAAEQPVLLTTGTATGNDALTASLSTAPSRPMSAPTSASSSCSTDTTRCSLRPRAGTGRQ